MVATEEYKALDDAAKVKAVQNAYKYVNDLAKKAIKPDSVSLDGWVENLQTTAENSKDTAIGIIAHVQEEYVDKELKKNLWNVLDANDQDEFNSIREHFVDKAVGNGEARSTAEDSFDNSVKELAKTKYIEESIDKDKITEVLTKYADLSVAEVKTEFKKWDFEIKYETSWGSRDKVYRLGNISKNELITLSKEIDGTVSSTVKLLLEEKGITDSEAISLLEKNDSLTNRKASSQVGKWRFELDYGYEWSKRADAFNNGAVSEANMRKALMGAAGDLSKDEADLEIKAYKWLHNNSKYDFTLDNAKAYLSPGEDLDGLSPYDVGIKPEVFIKAKKALSEEESDYDEDGDAIPYSKAEKVIARIGNLPIGDDEKTELALCFYKSRTVRRCKTW
jgi:hypothetical protein